MLSSIKDTFFATYMYPKKTNYQKQQKLNFA